MIKGSGKQKLTIKQEVFNVGFIFSMVTLLLFGSVLCVSIYFLEVNNAKDTLQGVNYHMAVVAKNESKSISSTLKVLSNDLDIREAGFADNIELTDEVKKLYRDYYNADNSITHIYSAYENGKIIINDWEPPIDFDPTTRPWYINAKKINENGVVQSRTYKDIISGQWQISSSTPLYSKSGEFVGALAIDRSANNMSRSINEKNLYKSQYNFIIDRHGKIMVHPDEDMIQKTFTYIGDEIPSFSGYINFWQNNQPFCAFYNSIGNSNDWYLVSVVNKTEILLPLYKTMVALLLLSIFLALILGFYHSKILNTRFAMPMMILGDRIRKITNAEPLESMSYHHSNDEIIEVSENIEKLAQIALQNKEEKLKTILFSVTDGVIATDRKGIVDFVNPVANAHIKRLENRVIGRKIEDVFDIYNDKDSCKVALGLPKSWDKNLDATKDYYATMKTQNGIKIPIEYNISPICDASGMITGMVIVFRDFTDKKKKQDKYEFLSYQDPLTGIYNRRYFDEQIIALDTEENLPISIIYADINGLKLANDLKGHITGDKLIKMAANSIKDELRSDDIFSRIGGDEFGIVLAKADRETVENLIDRIRASLKGKKIDGISLSISFGYATKHNSEQNILSILTDSDKDMYNNKIKESPEHKKNTIIDFQEALEHKNKLSSGDE